MSEPPYPGTGNDRDVDPGRESTPSRDHETAHTKEPARGSWAGKVVVALLVGLVVLIVVLHLTGPRAH
jgi:hypothetical protein